MRAPAGFEIAEVRGAFVAARPGGAGFVADAVRRSGSLHAFARDAGGAGLRGRTTAWTLTGPGRDWVVRHYTRGGAIARFMADRYLRLGRLGRLCRLCRPRPVVESEVSDRARVRGVATPEVQAFVVYPHGLYYRADIATTRIPGARDLAEVSLGPERGDESVRIEAWRAAGSLLRDAFRAGVLHSDLNLRNIVVSWSDGPAVAHLLDLDRCRLVQRSSPGHVHAMLQRMHRSRLKLETQSGNAVDATALAAFEDALDG